MNAKNGALLKAVASTGEMDECSRILESEGVDVNERDSQGNSSIILASKLGKGDVVELLLSKGASIKDKSSDGRSPLHVASHGGHLNVALLLLHKGASVNDETYHGLSPLFLASINGSAEVIELLISKGADVNQKRPDGWGPLHVASRCGHANIVALLLSSGANVHDRTVDPYRYTCFDLAKTDKVQFVLRKWPTTMAILALKELGLYCFVKTDSLIDLFHFLGKEDFTPDNSEDYDLEDQ